MTYYYNHYSLNGEKNKLKSGSKGRKDSKGAKGKAKIHGSKNRKGSNGKAKIRRAA